MWWFSTVTLSSLFQYLYFQHEESLAAYSRIKFCRLFFLALLGLSKEKVQLWNWIRASCSFEIKWRTWSACHGLASVSEHGCFVLQCQGVSEAQKYLKQMSELLTTIKKRDGFGSQTWTTRWTCSRYDILGHQTWLSVILTDWAFHAAHPLAIDTDYPTIMGFEPLVNQRLLPPTFPRYTKIKQRGETLEYLEQLTSRLLSVCSVMELNSLHHILASVSHCMQCETCWCLLATPEGAYAIHRGKLVVFWLQIPVGIEVQKTIRNRQPWNLSPSIIRQ